MVLWFDCEVIDCRTDKPGNAAREDQKSRSVVEFLLFLGEIVDILVFEPEFREIYMDSWTMPVTR